jgi:hypothetical protein
MLLGCGSAIAKRDLGIAVLGIWECDSEARPRNRFGDIGSAIAIWDVGV